MTAPTGRKADVPSDGHGCQQCRKVRINPNQGNCDACMVRIRAGWHPTLSVARTLREFRDAGKGG